MQQSKEKGKKANSDLQSHVTLVEEEENYICLTKFEITMHLRIYMTVKYPLREMNILTIYVI